MTNVIEVKVYDNLLLAQILQSLKKFSTKTSCVILPSLLSISPPMLGTSTLPTAEPWNPCNQRSVPS
ncbi:hypothetical protein DPMN_005867 [Dreissena polymorpha]|uniref:Uncharacterized protein n=1 Tax=Dreissena polymorpha TaxID=45954 RepID=A0A9D4RUX3_DREPO|nr:hypothetical protein DPMN_005867 [Dreissena polymorpha]